MIELNNISKIYQDGTIAVNNVSLEINKGEIAVFLGPSGCGKSTLLRMINRMEKISSGSIFINGTDSTSYKATKLRQKIGYVIQQIGLFPNKTVEENVGIIPKILGWNKKKIQSRVYELLELIQLNPEIYAKRYPRDLSGGQQQRVGVARALAADADILLMDEPFGAIDPITREDIQDEFLKLQEKLKKTIVFVSHDIHEAIKLADKIALFRKGELIQYDTPEIILTQPANSFVESFIGSDASLKMLALIKVRDIVKDSKYPYFESHTSMQIVQAELQKKQMKYGVVVRDKKLLGYVSLRDLRTTTDPIADLVQPLTYVLRPKDSLKDAISKMLVSTLPFVVIEEKGEFYSAIGFKDFQQAILELSSDDAQ